MNIYVHSAYWIFALRANEYNPRAAMTFLSISLLNQ